MERRKLVEARENTWLGYDYCLAYSVQGVKQGYKQHIGMGFLAGLFI
jgi:hypothetical protein